MQEEASELTASAAVDYDPEAAAELYIPILLRRLTPLLDRITLPMEGIAGHLMGLPPSNLMYQLHWATVDCTNTGLAFILRYAHGTVGVPFDQPVACTTGNALHFDSFVVTVLKPALAYFASIGDTGVRVTLSWDTAHKGHLQILAGCNLPGRACVVYTLEFVKIL